MKLNLDPQKAAKAIVIYVDGIGNGLSTEHERKLEHFIVTVISAGEIKEEQKKKDK